MKGHVKLTTAEHRAWRVNKAHWVSPKGIVLRAVTPEEEQAIFPFVERTKRTGRTETYAAKVVYKVRSAQGQIVQHDQPMDITVRATKTGREAQSFLLDVFVNGNRYVKGREIIEKRMLARHGECMLFQPNGKRLRVIRNPKLARPTFAESQRAAPHPDHCACRAFSDRREPGRHHIACEWNSKSPPHEQASPLVRDVMPTLVDSPEPLDSLAFDDSVQSQSRAAQSRAAQPAPDRYGGVILPPPPQPPTANPELAMRARGPVSYAPAAAAPLSPELASQHPTLGAPTVTISPSAPIRVDHAEVVDPRVGELDVYAPEECPRDCRGARNPENAWLWPPGRRAQRGQHHPLCPFDAPHRQSLAVGQRWVLYDIERRVEVRDAAVSEVAQSEVELQRSGARSVVISGRIYAVVAAAPKQTVSTVRQRALARGSAAAALSAHEQGRQSALAQSGLPSVPGSAPAQTEAPVTAREQALLSRLAELERAATGRQPPVAPEPLTARERALMGRLEALEHNARLSAPIGSGVAARMEPPHYLSAQPYAPPMPLPYEPLVAMPHQPAAVPLYDPQAALMTARPVAGPADHLRNDKGLVGHQQLGDDIPLGVVELSEPEPFVDPLPAMRVQAAHAPAPYHPGVVHEGAFVLPALPSDEEATEVFAPAPSASTETDDLGDTDLGSMASQDLGGPDDEDDGAEDDELDEETPIAAQSLTGFEPMYTPEHHPSTV